MASAQPSGGPSKGAKAKKSGSSSTTSKKGRIDPRLALFALAPLAGFVLIIVGCVGLCFGFPCFSTGFRYGMWIDQCPTGDVRLGARVDVTGVVRGDWGTVSVQPYGRFLHGEGAYAWTDEATMYRGVEVAMVLLDDDGNHVEGMVLEDFEKDGSWRIGRLQLPEVRDGDYTLRFTLTTAAETIDVDVALPLFAPAIAHLMTDRPLYKPGQEVLLRSVLLKRTDLSPLDGRPGRWRILSPDGSEMLREKDRAGAFGVAASSFPLDSRAAVGTWNAYWESGGASDTVSFEVRPFKLPRFTVEMTPSARWYSMSDTVIVEGTAKYSSGAPVADAPVEVTARLAEGRWPLPLEWEETFEARTGSDGSFEIDLGEVPGDLIERNVIAISARVTEEAGEVARGATRVILSEDDIMVEAVTELGDGLVGGFNNRAYIQVSTPDGRPLRLAQATVTNPWDALAKDREAETDEDGVLAVQIDPGDPVTVVIPAVPVRVRPLTPATPEVVMATEVLHGSSLDMAERRALDAIVPDIALCGDLAPGGKEVTHGLRVTGGGGVRDVVHGGTPLEECVADAARGLRFPVGRERTYAITWRVPDSLVATFRPNTRTAFGSSSDVDRIFADGALLARPCVGFGRGVGGTTVYSAHWRVTEGSRTVETTPAEAVYGTGLNATEIACIARSMSSVRLDKEARADALGTLTVSMSVPSAPSSRGGGATTRTGYELEVEASIDGAIVGDTRLILSVGSIPALRIRATPSLANPGDEVAIELIRGPDFYGDLPEEIRLMHGTVELEEVDLDEETRTATFHLPKDRDGFFHVDVSGARAIIYCQPANPLSVSVSSDAKAYRPGETAQLTITTKAGDVPIPAGVGLVGVDSTLAQLAPLLGPDDYGRVTVRATSDTPAFGAFDPRALTLGQVRGENAAKAAVLRISSVPMDAAGDERVSAWEQAIYDDEEVLIRSFYRSLEALHRDVRAWEAAAPEGELMKPETMVEMWNEVLVDLEKTEAPAHDAFGRPLTLDLLPGDLLAQVDPRQVVADGTRLPEDIVSWERFVDEEVR